MNVRYMIQELGSRFHQLLTLNVSTGDGVLNPPSMTITRRARSCPIDSPRATSRMDGTTPRAPRPNSRNGARYTSSGTGARLTAGVADAGRRPQVIHVAVIGTVLLNPYGHAARLHVATVLDISYRLFLKQPGLLRLITVCLDRYQPVTPASRTRDTVPSASILVATRKDKRRLYGWRALKGVIMPSLRMYESRSSG